LDEPVFTWNVFPLHPHEKGQPLTNRCHTRSERHSCRWLLLALLDLLQPTKVIAIGNDAALGLADLGVDCLKVRHPSYGGVADFQRGIWSIYGRNALPNVSLPSPQLI
jgi:uracil-DNA glycosylase